MKRAIFLLVAGTILSGIASYAASAQQPPVELAETG